MILKNFVVFEGLDGTGTTSQIRLLQEAFASRGRHDTVLFTCEPTDGSIGKLIRGALSGMVDFDAQTIAYLFGADRCEHIYGKEGILAQLKAGKAVFSDRYLFSSLAYQGLAAGKELTQAINAPFPLPEYLFFFDLPAKTAMERIEKRNIPREIYEKEVFQQKVAEEYQVILRYYAETAPDMRIIRIDAAQSITEIHEKIWSIVCNLPII
ncbi:dTMP kinase [Treponema sp. OMZ 857]|uniref:dTMP kinase n=1 Tax=Treponema sp. OMZ 857 TaxID=1643513 RepID=UPI0020A56DC3|nr:dTMP kinase [Treponema sp. OMZ 857]UTC44321.1 dTMP kinase [Treponema sp. OMZ 857]